MVTVQVVFKRHVYAREEKWETFVVCRRDILFYKEATGYVAHQSKVSYATYG